MRISTQQMWKSTLGNINDASVRQAAAGERISSGRRITKASDDPTGADRSAQLRANSSAIEQYERAGSDAVAFMNAQDRTLQTVLDRLNRVKELTIAMATGPLTSEAREVAAIEVEEVRTELVAALNTMHGEKSLFGGFQDVALSDSPGGVTYTGDAGTVMRRVASDQVVQVNLDASELLGFSAGRSLFDVLDDIALDARAGDVPSLGNTRLDELETVRLSVNKGLGLVGTRTSRLEAKMTDLSIDLVALTGEVSDLESADIVEASIMISEANLAYEAALAASAQINRVSLLNYL